VMHRFATHYLKAQATHRSELLADKLLATTSLKLLLDTSFGSLLSTLVLDTH
jgi:hypothetical protein